jgi:adenine deaminase
VDGTNFFGIAGVINFLPEGWEKIGTELSKAQDEALAKRAPALMAAIARPISGALAFRNVRLYDADARQFRGAMTVVVENGKVAAIGPTFATQIPGNAQVIEGAGKTLIPGLWDNHQHYGDDSTGPLLLATGITSVRATH